MSWENFRLADRSAGSEYGENTLRVAEALKKLNVSADRLPAVVWVYHPEDDRENRKCEANIFRNEQVGLALRKFRALRLDVTTIGREDIREEYERQTPCFLFFDPAGEQLAEVKGRKASLSGFSNAMEHAWRKSFTSKLRTYTKSYARLLDRIDRLTGRKTVLDQAKESLAEKPNPRKARQIEADERELAAEQEKIEAEEQALSESVKLRPEFLPADDAETARK